jgi:hypothetical protein
MHDIEASLAGVRVRKESIQIRDAPNVPCGFFLDILFQSHFEQVDKIRFLWHNPLFIPGLTDIVSGRESSLQLPPDCEFMVLVQVSVQGHLKRL